MKKVVITGATSMIGTALTEVAVKNGTEVYAVIRTDTKRKDRLVKSALVHPVYGDLDHLLEIKCLPADCDVLYHFACAGTGKTARDDAWVHEKNIRYTLEAVELAERTGCKRFVGAGSQAEYGPIYGGRIDEDTKYRPVNAYGIGKLASEVLSKKLCKEKNIDHVWGRVFSVYGPHDNKNTMLDYAIDCFLKGEIAHFSLSKQMWNYIYEDDAGEMFYRLGSNDVLPDIYFVANTESRPLKEYIEILMKIFGPDAKGVFADDDGACLPGLDVDMSKTINAIGPMPMVSFMDGVTRMIEARIQNPKSQIGGV